MRFFTAVIACAALGCATAPAPIVEPPPPPPLDVSGAVVVPHSDARCPEVRQLRRGFGWPEGAPALPLSCDDDAVTVHFGPGAIVHVEVRGDVTVVVVDDACAQCGGASITSFHNEQCRQQGHDSLLRVARTARLVVVTPIECDPRLP